MTNTYNSGYSDQVTKLINTLQPGQAVTLSSYGNTYCTAERSGDGSTVRFVRNTPNGFTVFKTCKFWN